MSTETLNRIVKEVNALTPQERREFDRTVGDESKNAQDQMVCKPGPLKATVKYMASDVDGSALSSLRTHEEEIPAETATLREWVNEARNTRAKLPLTSDSVDLLRELREVRSKQ